MDREKVLAMAERLKLPEPVLSPLRCGRGGSGIL